MDAAEKTLSVLDALGTTQADGGSRLGSIAARAELPKSTVHRILKRLVERGYARAQGDGVYVLGPRILAMAGGMLDQLDAGPAARAVLRDLHADVGHTVHFAMLSGDEAVYLEKLVDPNLPYQTASRVGGRIPLHCTAIGKSILATMTPDEARALLGAAQARAPDAEDARHAVRHPRGAGPGRASRASPSTTRRTSATSAAWGARCSTTAAAPPAR